MFWIDLLIGGTAVAMVAGLGVRRPRLKGWVAATGAVVHPMAAFALFGTLAWRLHGHLDGWPRFGDSVPGALRLHFDLAQHAFGSVLLGTLFALPAAAVICAAFKPLRPGLPTLGLYALAAFALYGGTLLAPEPYLAWWWD